MGYDTENEAVVEYFKEKLKDYPFHMKDYLFKEPFLWEIEKVILVYTNIQLNMEWDLEAYTLLCLKIIMFF